MQVLTGGFSLKLGWPQVSKDLLNILAHLNNAMVWMLLILPLISSSLNHFSRPLKTIPRALTTNDITVTFVAIY